MGRTKTWSVKPLFIVETLLIITGLIMVMMFTGCDDATTPKPAQSGSSASDSKEEVNPDMDEEEFRKFKEELDADRGWNDQEMTYGIDRISYFTGINHEDMVRYTDQYLYSLVFMERWAVRQIYAQDDYLLENTDFGTERYIHIYTGDAIKTANPVVGDIVTVYGMFCGTDTITWQNGTSDTAPAIDVHQLYVNNIVPADLAAFTEGFVTLLNSSDRAHSNEAQYLSGTKIKALCSIEKSVGFNNTSDDWNGRTSGDEVRWHVHPYSRYNGFGFLYFKVDGYNVDVDDGLLNGEELDPMFLQYADDNDMFWATINIVSLDPAFDFYNVKFEVESIEPAGMYIGDYIPAEDYDDIDE